MSADLQYPARILVFYSSTCPGCIRKLGLKNDGIAEKEQTNLTKALVLMKVGGFEVIRYDINVEENKARLLSITARGDAFIPIIITPFAVLENPPILSIMDLIDAMLGLKTLATETHH
jgi:hypothetical protein